MKVHIRERIRTGEHNRGQGADVLPYQKNVSSRIPVSNKNTFKNANTWEIIQVCWFETSLMDWVLFLCSDAPAPAGSARTRDIVVDCENRSFQNSICHFDSHWIASKSCFWSAFETLSFAISYCTTRDASVSSTVVDNNRIIQDSYNSREILHDYRQGLLLKNNTKHHELYFMKRTHAGTKWNFFKNPFKNKFLFIKT